MDKLSKVKMNILEFLWLANEPIRLKDIAKSLGLKARCVNMHLLNLKRGGYVATINGGLYVLTDLGKEALGFPKIDGEAAKKILSPVTFERAFHFYSEIDRPLMISSYSLDDFYEKVRKIDLKSIEFHSTRGDFEEWIRSLGDIELARRLRVIRESNVLGEELREKICKNVKSRCEELRRIALGAQK
ncbi:MAG: hypothetical protein QXK89_04800 [Candidatus Bathyarchaeia archaeon]